MNSANNTNDLIWYLTEAEWWNTHYGDGYGYGYGDGDGYGDGYGYGYGYGYVSGSSYWNSTSTGMNGAANGNGILIYRGKICK